MAGAAGASDGSSARAASRSSEGPGLDRRATQRRVGREGRLQPRRGQRERGELGPAERAAREERGTPGGPRQRRVVADPERELGERTESRTPAVRLPLGLLQPTETVEQPTRPPRHGPRRVVVQAVAQRDRHLARPLVLGFEELPQPAVEPAREQRRHSGHGQQVAEQGQACRGERQGEADRTNRLARHEAGTLERHCDRHRGVAKQLVGERHARHRQGRERRGREESLEVVAAQAGRDRGAHPLLGGDHGRRHAGTQEQQRPKQQGRRLEPQQRPQIGHPRQRVDEAHLERARPSRHPPRPAPSPRTTGDGRGRAPTERSSDPGPGACPCRIARGDGPWPISARLTYTFPSPCAKRMTSALPSPFTGPEPGRPAYNGSGCSRS